MMLETRSLAEEQMDAADLPEADYAALLSDLARANALTLAARPTLGFLRRLETGGRLKLLDVGFGQGDMLRRIARWAARRGIAAELVGIDLNPRSARVARAATRGRALPIDYRTGDYADLAGEGWDVVISSLVAHHMSAAQLVAFLRFMEAEARLGWFVNDLHRHRFAHAGFPLLAHAMGWHRIVREDGTLSIARSYRPAEWVPLLAEAGIPAGAAAVKRVFPFRLCVERRR